MSVYIKSITMKDVLLNDLVDHWHGTPQTENLYEFIGRNILGIEIHIEDVK